MVNIYLNSAATTKPTDLALNKFIDISRDHWHNPSATMSEDGIEARRFINKAREDIASMISASPDEIIFTSGATEGANMIIKGFIPRGRERDYGIICSPIEHPAVWETVQYMKQCGVDVEVLDVNGFGDVNLDHLVACLDKMKFKDGILVCVMDSNNEIGTRQHTMEIADIVHEYPRAYLFSDMTQSYAHGEIIDANILGYDFAVASAHKFGGLKGCGFVYIRYRHLIQPLIHGGGQEYRLRSGTENVAGICSMAEAFKQRESIEYVKELNVWLRIKLISTFDNCVVLSPEDGIPCVLSVMFPGCDANEIVSLLEIQGVHLSAGSACHTGDNVPSRVLKAIGLSDEEARSVIRISLSEDIITKQLDDFVVMLRGVVD